MLAPRRHVAGPGRTALLLAPLLALVVACGGSTPSGPATSPTGTGASPSVTLGLPTPGLSSGAASPSSTAPSTVGGSTGPTPSNAATPPAGATASPTSPGTSATPNPDVAAACTGSADNQAFFAAVAAGVHWTVYCAVLPAGWFFQQGAYELGAGGQMTVTYRGPAGVHLQLQQGAFCTGGASACTNGTPAGSTAYGSLDGQLSILSPGYAVYVSPGQPPSWAAASVDLDEATFVRLVAGLQAVAKP